ncbi:MAG: hypothetical protein NTW29_22690 [Bacteroidetes bacterium]|nr:hypothetical protein [Bacteroidota bacterium]
MKKYLVLLLLTGLLFNPAGSIAQSVSINNTSAAPDPKSMLDISSNSKGILIPRMTQAERDAITSPPTGLLLYNTSSTSFQYYSGVTWINITNSGILNGIPNKVPRFLGIWGLTNGIMMDDGNGVSMNNTSTLANSSAILDMTSTTKGVLIPRMTSLQRTSINTPATGLLVYDTNLSVFMFFNGNNWTNINGNGVSDWNVNGIDIFNNNTGNVGIGTNVPAARLAVDSSIMVDQANSNQGFLDRSSLYFGSDKKVGIVRSFLTGSSGRNGMGFFTNNTRRMTIDSTGQVGIGTINPLQTLHVNGNSYFVGNLGIGNSTPDYAFDNQYGYNYMFYGLGIGTIPSATYLLDVGASTSGVRFRGDFRVDGIVNPTTTFVMGENASVAGSLTVNGGKGVAYNGGGATNLRISPFTTANFHVILGPHSSNETTITLPGGFTSTPRVFVGSIRATGGTSGELNRVILVLWGCDTNSCNAKVINTDNASVDYNVTWDCLAIGN